MESNKVISELDILVNTEYQLANQHWNNMYQMLADLSASLYPYIEIIAENKDDYPILANLAMFIKRCRLETRGSLDTYTKKILVGYLYGRIKGNYNIKDLRQLSRYFIAISSLDDNGNISLDSEWKEVLSSPWGVPMNNSKENSSHPQTEAIFQKRDTEDVIVKRERKSIATSDAERRLEKFWFKITSGHFDYQYFWRNKINTDDYNELKNRLQECAYENRRGFAQRYGRVMALYIAEWYKREYNGNDGKDNAIKNMRLPYRPEEIWKYSGLPDNFLYRQKNNRYLDSMYVLGGLPINYLIHKQFNKVFKEIQSVYKQKESEESLQNNIFINNYTLQEATRSQWGSLHMYFDALMRDDYPFAQEDFDKEPFRTFLANLQEWNPMRKKFSIEWIVEGNMDVEMFRRKLRLYVTPEYKGERNRSISYGRMSRWGVSTTTKSFRIYAFFNDADPDEQDDNEEYITFYNTYDGYFVGELTRNYYTFKNIPDGNITKVTLYVKVGYMFKEIYSFDIDNYLQLYETNQYSILSDRKSDKNSYALLPYDTNVKISAVDIDDLPKRYFTEDGISYKLIPIIGELAFEDEDGETVSLYSKEHDIDFSIQTYSNDIQYTKGNLCKHFYIAENGDEKEEFIPVIFSADDVKAVSYIEGNQPKKLSKDIFRLEYKLWNESNFHEWKQDEYPIGTIKIRVTYNGEHTQKTVFAVCSDNIAISRDCDLNIIKIDKHVPLVNIPEELEAIESHQFRDNVKQNRKNDTIPFKIGRNDDYIIIPVYRTFNIMELYCHDNSVKSYSDVDSDFSIEIPFLLKDNYTIRKVDDRGVHRLNLKETSVDYLDFHFDDDANAIESVVEKSTSVGKIRFTLCSSLYLGTIDYVSMTGSEDDYHFYHWTMKESEEPKEIAIVKQDGQVKLRLEDYQKKTGVIFQGLKDGACPRTYYAPVYHEKWPKADKRGNIREKCFAISAKYYTPFRIFEPILDYFKGTDSDLVDLAARYLSLDKYKDIPDDDKFKALIRFSHELYFSWPFLNRKTWKDMPKRFVEAEERHELTPDMIAFLKSKYPEEWTEYCKSKGIGSDAKEELRKKAEHLFVMCGKKLTNENFNSLKDIARAYWKHRDEKGFQFARFDMRWYGYDQNGQRRKWNDHSDELPEQAVCFMRPKPIKGFLRIYKNSGGWEGYSYKYPRIIGFTNQENKEKDGEEVRNIDEIIDFLHLLYNDKESFIKIEQFLKKYLFDYNAS